MKNNPNVPYFREYPESYYLNIISSKWYITLTKLHDVISRATMDFWSSRNVKTLYLPITTSSISSPMGLGSDSSPVKINLFGVQTYLADSMQFMLEYGCRFLNDGCYYIMPSFRGEKADARHLCQFYHSEAELPCDLNGIMSVVEEYILHITRAIYQEMKNDLAEIVPSLSHIEELLTLGKKIFKRITFEDAVELLQSYHKDIEKYVHFNEGYRVITSAGELEILKILGDFVWITNYDILNVPFYQMTDPHAPTTTKNADLLFGIGEVVGSGERHETADQVIESLNKRNVDSKPYEWYITMKNKFPLKTSGFGMGVERYLMWLLQHNDIRDMQICLRYNGFDMIP